MNNNRLRLNPDLRMSWDESGGIILDVRSNRIYSLNNIGALMLKEIEQGTREIDIAAMISQKFQAPIELVINDLQKFKTQMLQKKFLQRVTPKLNESTQRKRKVKCSKLHLARGGGFAGLISTLYWLLSIELRLRLCGFNNLYNYLKYYPVKEIDLGTEIVLRVCRSMDTAGTLYWRHALCLQRSAATLCLLRLNGVAATMVIGASRYPFKAHAWVEVNGIVVNDRSGVRSAYLEIDRL